MTRSKRGTKAVVAVDEEGAAFEQLFKRDDLVKRVMRML